MDRWRAVVFDLDDTLYPERDFVRGGLNAAADWAAGTLGVDPAQTFADLWSMFEAGVRGDTFDRWLRQRGWAEEGHRQGMVAAYRGHAPRLTLYPDVLPALAGLRGEARLGLITEGSRPVQQAKLAALGLSPRLDRVVILGEDERQHWKPSPTPFERWLEGEVIQPGEALYIGDNPAKDFLGARRAGWASARVRRPDGLHRAAEPASREAAPDFELPDLTALAQRVRLGAGR